MTSIRDLMMGDADWRTILGKRKTKQEIRPNRAQCKDAADLYRSGLSLAQVAERLQVTQDEAKQSIMSWLARR